MTSLRSRHKSPANIADDNDFMTSSSLKNNAILGFSDDDDDIVNHSKDRIAHSVASTKADGPPPSDITNTFLSDGAMRSSGAETEEMDEDLDLFDKTVNVSDLDKIDHVSLLRKMHDRFKRKVEKWERLAYSFARYCFAMNFMILVLQLLQMILHQVSNIWATGSKELMTNDNKPFLQRIGVYKLSEWKKSRKMKSRGYETDASVLSFAEVFLDQQCLQTVNSLITAVTALIAGLQLKLKLSEKAERYRKGAKIYGRLLRISSYYLMMVESGGKVDDVTALWRDAMKKEGKWIPLVRSYIPL